MVLHAMDISSNEEEELGRDLKNCELNTNFISNLPDHIRVHILSFLPLRDAIKTVLLQSFGKLWLSMPVLDLDNCSHDCETYDPEEEDCYDKFMDIIHQVWNYHDNIELDNLHLKFSFRLIYSKVLIDPDDAHSEMVAYEIEGNEKEKAAAEQIEKLVENAVRRKVKVLDLNFMGCGTVLSFEELYNLPDLFRSNYLRDLKLTACDIRSHEDISLPALKVLSLREVSLSNEVMKKFLLGCPLLEELSVICCHGFRNLNCMNPKLTKVMVSVSMRINEPLLLYCPHVVSLKVSGGVPNAVLLHVSPSLVDAEIDFSYLFELELGIYLNVCWFLMMVEECRTFTLCTCTILMLSVCNLKNYDCPPFNWKNVIIPSFGLTKWHLPGLCFLLKHCPSLETLTMQMSPGEDFIFKTDAAKCVWDYDFDGDSYWDSHEVNFPCLESVAISGHINEPYVIQLVEFLLKNATNLQKMEISTKITLEDSVSEDIYTSEQLLEFSQKLVKFPRASTEAIIYLS